MLGAIAGDVIGSRFEIKMDPEKSKEFDLFKDVPGCSYTDDTVLTLATAKAVMEIFSVARKKTKKVRKINEKKAKKIFTKHYQEMGLKYPDAGYGQHFSSWLNQKNPKPYDSLGNGSAMRVSPCALAASSLYEAIQLAELSASVSHNNPEGIKGARAVAAAIYLAKTGKTKSQIKLAVESYYKIAFTLEDIRPQYCFDVTCPGSVPQSIECFLESDCYEDCIRNVISLGGDADTMGAIAGSIAGQFYEIPDYIKEETKKRLEPEMLEIIEEFNNFINQ